MRSLFILIAHLLVTLARLTCPGGVRAIAAESLAVKHLCFLKNSSAREETRETGQGHVAAVDFESGKQRRDGYSALFLSRPT
jgi:hypothetical protein